MLLTGNARSKGTTPPKSMTPYLGERKSDKKQTESDPFGIRGVIYEEDPVKLQEIMDKTDREREELHRRLSRER